MRLGFGGFLTVFDAFLEHTFVTSRYDVYVESSLDHYLALAKSAALSAVSGLQNGEVVTAANVAAARALVDQVDTMYTRIIASFADSPAIRDDGYRNISEWLAHNTHARPGEGEHRLAHAEVFAKLPGWSDAVDAGTVGVSHVGVVAKVAYESSSAVPGPRRTNDAGMGTNTVVLELPQSSRSMGFTLRRHTR